tara:strand:- start:3740 stop:4132 length:393 start_codon:yes stop_codon:yes gene_type:complete
MLKFDAIWRFGEFSGRSDRAEFWTFFLLCSSLALSAEKLDLYFATGDKLMILVQITILVPYLAVSIRRLHDMNFRGWWCLLGLIPNSFGAILLHIAFLFPGNKGDNKYNDADLANADKVSTASITADAKD